MSMNTHYKMERKDGIRELKLTQSYIYRKAFSKDRARSTIIVRIGGENEVTLLTRRRARSTTVKKLDLFALIRRLWWSNTDDIRCLSNLLQLLYNQHWINIPYNS